MGFRQNNKSKIEWQSWLIKNQNVLIECGLPEICYQSKSNWFDFLQHGYLDHHEDASNFVVDELSFEQMIQLGQFLKDNLDETDKNSLIIVQILQSKITNQKSQM